MVEGVIGADESLLPYWIKQGRLLWSLKFRCYAQFETTRILPIFAVGRREHAKRHELIAAGEIFLLQPREVLRPLSVPVAGLRRTRRVHASNTRIEQRLNGRI